MTSTTVPASPRSTSIILLGLAAGAIALASCGNIDVDYEFGQGDLTTRDISVAEFDSVEVDAIFDVAITVEDGADPRLTIETETDTFDNVIAEVENGTLHLDLDSNMQLPHELVATIVVPSLTAIDVDGASSVTIEGEGGDLLVTTQGATVVDASDYLANDITVMAGGASTVDVAATGAVDGVASGVAHIDVHEAATTNVSTDGIASVDRP